MSRAKKVEPGRFYVCMECSFYGSTADDDGADARMVARGWLLGSGWAAQCPDCSGVQPVAAEEQPDLFGER